MRAYLRQGPDAAFEARGGVGFVNNTGQHAQASLCQYQTALTQGGFEGKLHVRSTISRAPPRTSWRLRRGALVLGLLGTGKTVNHRKRSQIVGICAVSSTRHPDFS